MQYESSNTLNVPSQNVGPVLEMVTEKYLLREEREWAARQEALAIFDEIAGDLERGDVKALGRATTRNFAGPWSDMR